LLCGQAFSDFGRLNLDDDLERAVRERVRDSLSSFEAYAHTVYGYLDCFYLRERYGIWGSVNARKLWSNSLAPFHSGRAMRLAAQLPPPWADRRILPGLIRRYLPPAMYWMPINGVELLAMRGPGSVRFWTRDTLRRGRVLANRLLPQRKAARSHERIRAELLAGKLHDPLRQSLLLNGSVALDLMSKIALTALLDSHRRTLRYLEPLGALATLESWRQQAEKAQTTVGEAEVAVTDLWET
jgi:hypothetical protein